MKFGELWVCFEGRNASLISRIFMVCVTLGSPGYGQGPLGPADIRSATRLPPQPPGPPGVPLGDMGEMLLIF